MATIGDVARLAGVSVSTAGRALSGNGYAKQETRRRVQAAAEELGYVPNHIARSLRSRTTKMVGLLIADVENTFYSVIAKNVESVLKETGNHVVLCNHNDDPKEESEYLTLLESMGVDGLIITPTPQNRRALERLQNKGMIIVQIDRRVNGLRSDAIVVDNQRVSAQAVTHLIDRGHTRIGILTGPTRVTTAKERLAGYQSALAEHDLPFRPELVRAGSFQRDHAVQDATSLIRSELRPTALFATNNILGEACVQALTAHRLRIPEDMSLLAFDDLPWMTLMTPHVSTVRQPIADMARSAADLLRRRLGGGDHNPTTVVFDAELVPRDSVGAAPARVAGA